MVLSIIELCLPEEYLKLQLPKNKLQTIRDDPKDPNNKKENPKT